MKKWFELPVTVAVFALIAVPVLAGIYVGVVSDKDSHGPHKGGQALAAEAHGGVELAAAGTGGGHPPSVTNHDDGLEPGVPGVSDGHAPQPGTTPDHPKAPEIQIGDGMKPKLCSFQELVGLSGDVAEQTLRAASRIYRKVKPGMPLTMDYSADRYNLDIDDHGVVTRVWCG